MDGPHDGSFAIRAGLVFFSVYGQIYRIVAGGVVGAEEIAQGGATGCDAVVQDVL